MAINRIKAVLAEKGVKNKWLATKLGKSESTVSNWCTNEHQPSLETLVEIAEALGVETSELLTSKRNNL